MVWLHDHRKNFLIVKKKKVVLRPISISAEKNTPVPISAKKEIPKWYKNIPRYVNNGIRDGIKNPFATKSAKMCMPFFDSISSGYLLKLPYDIFCTFDQNGKRIIKWGTDEVNVIDVHDIEQIGDYPIPIGYENNIFKFISTWCIQTPKGFSSLYMHPLGRFDLPFYSLHGIVDSDVFYKSNNIPFVLKKDFEGLIEQGTPISQIIPVKRESWHSEIKKFNDDGYNPAFENLNVMMSAGNWYKNNRWIKKQYD